MSTPPTRNISLTPVLEGYIRAQIDSGHYSNASEVVSAGLRLLIERDARVMRNGRETVPTKQAPAR